MFFCFLFFLSFYTSLLPFLLIPLTRLGTFFVWANVSTFLGTVTMYFTAQVRITCRWAQEITSSRRMSKF